MTERVESQGFFEMLWDCDHCDTKGLFAKSQRHCPECGAPQSAIKRYFPKPEEQRRVDGHVYQGADRHCPACNAPMSAKGKNCTQCGSPMDGSKEVGGVVAAKVVTKPKRKIWPFVLAGIVLLCFAIWFLFIRKKEATLAVSSHKWTTSIAIEEFNDYENAAWRNELPNGTLPFKCVSKERSKRQVPDGEDCHIEKVDKKDGTFEQLKKCSPKYRSEPVNDDWCTYKVRTWKERETVKKTGTGMELVWPDAPPANMPGAMLGARRSGARTATYTLEFPGGRTCDVSDSTWKKYSDGQKVKLEVRARSGEIVCSSL